MAALASDWVRPTMFGHGDLLGAAADGEARARSRPAPRVPAAGSVLTAWPAGMLALVFCAVLADDEAGSLDGRGGVGLGLALDVGHGREGRAGADVEETAVPALDLAVGGRVLGQDGVLGGVVLDGAGLADGQARQR